MKISAEYLRECLEYDSSAGCLIWKVRPASHFSDGQKTKEHEAAIWNAKYSGKVAFLGKNNWGYYTGSLTGKRMAAHRVIWAIYYGSWPKGEIDHINGIKTDNSIDNLRVVSRAENAKNLKVKSGVSRGVYWYSPTSRWVAKITNKSKMIHLGYFIDFSAAVLARRRAEKQYGFHANHGRQS